MGGGGVASSLAFLGAVVLLLAAWAAALTAGRRGETVAPWARLAASAAPPVAFTLVVLLAASQFGALRVALEGLRFEVGETAVPEVRVGGSPDDDHLVVRDLPPGYLTFQADADGNLVARVRPVAVAAEPPATGDVEADTAAEDDGAPREAGRTYALLRVGGRDGRLHNTFPLADGDPVVAGGEELVFDAGRPGFRPAAGGGGERGEEAGSADVPAIPGRRGFLGLPLGRALPPEVEIYPLRGYGRPDGPPLGAFVYRGGGPFWGYFRSGFRLALPDDGAELRQAGLETDTGAADAEGDEAVRFAVFEPVAATLADGGSERFALFRVDEVPPPESEDDPRSRIQERRSFRATWRDGVLELILDSPYFVDLSRAHLGRLGERIGDEPTLAVVGRGAAALTQDDRLGYLDFPVVGAPLAGELYSRLRPEGDRLRVTTHTGNRALAAGDAFAVGDRMAALVRVSRLAVPWGSLLLVWATALAAWVAGAGLRRRALPLLLVSGVEMLLAVRLLIAYQGAYLDPAVAEAAWISLAAWAMVPFVVQTARAGYRRRDGDGFPAFATLTHLAVAELAVGAALVAAGSGPWRLAAALVLPPALAFAAGPLLVRCDGLLARVPGWRPGSAADWRPWAKGVAVLGGSLFLLRLFVLVAFAWKERMDLGGAQLAVSVWYTPAALAVVALVWAGRRWAASLPIAWGALLALFAVVPWAVHDWGVLLIFSLPPLLLLALAPWLPPAGGWPRGRVGLARWLHAAPLAGALLLTATVGFFVPTAGTAVASDAESPGSAAAAQEQLAAAVAAETNELRLWGWAAPERLREIGTGSAESLRVVIANLEAYGGRGALGEGYLRVPLAPALAATHLNDNLSAVHVLATFGWAGGAGLLAMLAVWALAPLLLPAAERSDGSTDALPARRAFGLLLVWTFTAAGFYMFSANVALSLFTGKNVYLLAAASLSDLVEATLLVVLALWAFEAPTGVGAAKTAGESEEAPA